MSSKTKALVLMTAAAVLTSLSGCSDWRDDGTPRRSESDMDGGSVYGRDCSFGDPYEVAEPQTVLPKDVSLVSAERCVLEIWTEPDSGTWLLQLRQRAVEGLDGLAAALRMSSKKLWPWEACTTVMHPPVIIALTDQAGNVLHPLVPTEACGSPLGAVIDAFDNVNWITVSTIKVSQLDSDP